VQPLSTGIRNRVHELRKEEHLANVEQKITQVLNLAHSEMKAEEGKIVKKVQDPINMDERRTEDIQIKKSIDLDKIMKDFEEKERFVREQRLSNKITMESSPEFYHLEMSRVGFPIMHALHQSLDQKFSEMVQRVKNDVHGQIREVKATIKETFEIDEVQDDKDKEEEDLSLPRKLWLRNHGPLAIDEYKDAFMANSWQGLTRNTYGDFEFMFKIFLISSQNISRIFFSFFARCLRFLRNFLWVQDISFTTCC
jgi:hypothetical protein